MAKNPIQIMIQKALHHMVLIFCPCYLFLFNFSSFAQTTPNDNLCTQVQCVKIQNGYLWVLSSDNVTYVPYFVKAVGYQPMPIGRHPSDWGYAATDPRSAINNIYDDPAILNRDFTLLQQMNANTIRLWNASNIQAPSGEFPNTMTMNTLNTAQQYGLKVIPGFWVNPLTFDANNNIGSTDNLGNPLTAQQIINDFVTFVNAYKGSPGILFWAIGNENNYQSGLTAPQLTAWYSLVNQMAQAAHNAEGAYYHPVAVVNGDIAEIGNAADGATDAELPYLDIWGANIYRGESFGTLFSQYAAQSQKPLWISEYGIDAFSTTTDTTIIAEINDWQNQMSNPGVIAQEGSADTTTQSSWDGSLWNEILNNSPVTIGASLMEYSDEWWMPNEWMCTVPNPTNDPTIQAENVASETYCVSTHSNFGFTLLGASPDNYTNSEWWGIMSISPNLVVGGADIMTPRPIYTNLQSQWQSNPWSQVTLSITGSGAGNISSPATSLGAGFNCNLSSSSSTGTCIGTFVNNQPVTLSFSSINNSTVTNWGVSSCSSGSATCTITPNANVVLNVTVTAPSGPTVTITSPVNNAMYTQPASIIFTANASAADGINNVEYYSGTSLIGISATSPYTSTWSFVNAGTYSITAVATDNAGYSKTSLPVSVTVAVPLSPVTVAITSPVYGAYVVAGVSKVTITTTASSTKGTIKRVVYYENNIDGSWAELGTATRSPYVYIWKHVPAGQYYLTAVATDSAGNTASSAVVLFRAGATTWSGNLTTNNTSYTAPANVVLTLANLQVSDQLPDSIIKVAFFNGRRLLGTVTSSPYTFTWKKVLAGTYNLTAVATDSHGVKDTFSAIPITVSPVVLPPQLPEYKVR